MIPGIEVSCIEGPHILLYFYNISELEEFYEKHIKLNRGDNPYMATKMQVSDLLERTKDYNCLRCAAHPYGYAITNSGLSKTVKKHYVEENVFDDIDAMEVINGGMNRWLNRKAEKRTKELNKSFTGGTDGHTIFELGRCVTSSDASDIDSFLTSILKKKNFVIGKETLFTPKLLHGTNMVTKHMKYAVPSIKMQYMLNKSRVKNMPNNLVKKTVAIKDKIKVLANGKH